MKNRLQYIFSWSKEGSKIIVIDKLKNKRVDNIYFPLGYLNFNIESFICQKQG